MSEQTAQEHAVEQMSDTVEKLTAPTRTVTLSNGTKVDIYKCKLKHFARVVTFVRDVFNALGITREEDANKLDFDDLPTMLDVIAGQVESLTEVTSMMCSLPKDKVEELEMDDALAVMVAIVELNRDFFMNQVMKVIAERGLGPTGE